MIVREGDDVALHCAASGIPLPTVLWRREDSEFFKVNKQSSKPTVHLSQKMAGAYIGETVLLKCMIEANPSPVVFWTHVVNNKLYNGSKYEMNLKSTEYKHTASLRVKNVTRKDIGSYYCYAENSLGTARDDVTVYSKYEDNPRHIQFLIDLKGNFYEPKIKGNLKVNIKSAV
ncbi:unnamed protein product [Arctia plantaginis]|uniref:Hemolin n=1 Tax=Arctia plantaginis TaxID=874455 RepID=A0A8S0ZZV7_ARCPL|nr:unnamed protein product [Arctia plantaginis]